MLRLKILSGKQAGMEIMACRFPFEIGRSPENHHSFDEPGVHARHLILSRTKEHLLEFSLLQPNALLSVNGSSIVKGFIKNGDLFEIGTLKFQIFFSSTVQSGYLAREIFIWMSWLAIILFQLYLIRFIQNS